MSGFSETQLQTSGMLTKEQLLHLFDRFSYLISQPDVKKRVADAVKDKQEAVAATTAIQEEILLEMGVDPGFGISCLGQVNTLYESDRDLMIRFYRFAVESVGIVSLADMLEGVELREEMACDEAELEPDEFEEKMQIQQKLQEQQLEMLTSIRKFRPDDQSAILEALHQQMENAQFDNSAACLTSEQIQEIVWRRISPLGNTR